MRDPVPALLSRWQKLRIDLYRRAWDCALVEGDPEVVSPVLLSGPGRISFDGRVVLGWRQAPGYLAGYSYIEARTADATVSIGDGTHLNNSVAIVSTGAGISIGQRCLIGLGVQIYDTDFHPLDPEIRHTDQAVGKPVVVGDNVFLGTNVLVLKGVSVGQGAVVGAGAVVVRDVPPATLVAGNPATIIREL